MGVEIRPMRPEDAGAVAMLSVELGYPATAAEMEQRLGVVLPDAGHAALVAVEGGEVVGWAHVHGSVLLQEPPFAELGGLVVAGDRRGTGVGRLLLAAAESWAVEHGYRLLRIRSNLRRDHAHGFYREEGYDVEKTSHTFLKTLGDG